jgi:DNA-binding NarL/FixJ family response regulator
MTAIRIVVADDQAVVRAGLRLILEAQPDLEVVAEATDGAHAVEVVAAHDPDIALVDIRMPVLDGIEATRAMLAAGARGRVIILTTYGVEQYVYEALRAGASGFLLKTDSPDRIVDGVRTVAAGDSILAPEITRHLIERYLSGAAPRAEAATAAFTDRELEVFRLLAGGRSNAEIARRLFLGEGTVKTHVAHILAKAGVRDRTQAVVYAYEHGIVRPGAARS